MNFYAIIEEFARYDKVTFYTVRCEEAVLSETDDFFERMDRERACTDQLQRLIAWIEDIGDNRNGAIYDLFRQERICLALPPKGMYLDKGSICGFIAIGKAGQKN